jgi:hypothetical protein
MDRIKLEQLINKSAFSCDDKKIGRIIRIDLSYEKVNNLQQVNIVIKYTRLFSKTAIIYLPKKMIEEVKKTKVVFTLTFQEFKKLVNAYLVERKRVFDENQARVQLKEDYDKACSKTLSRLRGLY